MITRDTAQRLFYAIHNLAQQIHVNCFPELSAEVRPLADLPIEELTEEQAETIINDAYNQCRLLREAPPTISAADFGCKGKRQRLAQA